MNKTIDVTFAVSISPCGDIDTTVELTRKEYNRLKKAIAENEETFEDFCDMESVADIYQKVCDSAYDDMANGLYDNKEYIQEHFNGEYVFETVLNHVKENFDIVCEFPELEDDED